MTILAKTILLLLMWLALAGRGALAAPPFSGTIFLDPDIITAADPTAFTNMTYEGQGMRTMFDRRVNAFITLNAYLFNAKFDDGLTAEIQVNPEFGNPNAAAVEARKYALVIGHLPTILRSRVQTVWIHQGVQPFGGGNENLLIHVGQADLYAADGILEETLVHESGHTSIDPLHASAPGWLAAQTADPDFISTYARDNPTREDIAESYLPWLAVRHRPPRISATLSNTIVATIPNRLAYFDKQNFNLYPIVQEITAVTPLRLQNVLRIDNGVRFDFTNSPGARFTVLASTNLALPLADWTVLGPPTEVPSGQYQFTDRQTSNSPQRFYRVRSP